jgi:hypothetical protein
MKKLLVLIVLQFIILFNSILQAQWTQTSSTGSGKVNGLVVNGSYVFAGTKPGGVYRSSNDGTNWTQVNNGLGITDINAVGANGTNIYSTAAINVYQTANNGTNWSSINYPTMMNCYCLAINGNNIYVGGDGGVRISTNNGTNWSVTNPQAGQGSLDTGSVYAMAVIGTNIFAGTMGSDGGGIYVSTNNGTSWTRHKLGKYIRALTVMGNNLFAGTQGGGVYISTDYGTNMTQVNNGLTSLYVYSFTVYGNSLFAGTNSGVFLSNDNGATWTQIGLAGNNIFSLAISGSNILAGTSTAGVWRRPLSDLTLPVELSYFTCNVLGNNVLLNWSTQTEKNSYIFNIERKSGSSHWESIGSIKASVLSNSPKQYSYSDNKLQSGKYLFRLKMIDNDGTFEYSKTIEAEIAFPKNFELSQNYPNPFNPGTVISYSLPLASYIKLIVYNTLGQTIKVLESGYKAAGNYSINFNASDLPGGIYFYKLEAGQFSQIKKMMLIK